MYICVQSQFERPGFQMCLQSEDCSLHGFLLEKLVKVPIIALYVWMYVLFYVHVNVHMHFCMYACYVYMYVYMYVCMYVSHMLYVTKVQLRKGTEVK